MATFPTPFGGSSALYPVTAGKRRAVAVHIFTDATEQRYRQSAEVSAFTLVLSGITKTAKDAVMDFFDTAKGSFDATWDITLGADSYDYMAFAEDSLTATESDNGLWAMTVPVVQTRKN